MITKSLSDLDMEKQKFENEINNTDIKEEKEALTAAFIDTLKFYLFETKKIIMDVFHTELTPFKTDTYKYNGLFKKDNTSLITKKSKQDFYKEIDDLAKSELYTNLSEEQKKLIDNAFYVLKTYYENSLE